MHSPNYDRYNPQNYTNDYQCKYLLWPPNSWGMLFFDCFFFQLQESVPCLKDSLRVEFGAHSVTYCGRDKPPSRLSQNFYITFKTDSSITDKGFLCTVMSKTSRDGVGPGSLSCGKHNLGPGTYHLLSQNYPNNYGTNLYCEWTLIPTHSSLIMDFSCSDFDVISWDNSCDWDWMKVNGIRYCNNNKPPSQQFQGTTARVEYATPDLPDKVRKGFNCTVVVREPSL